VWELKSRSPHECAACTTRVTRFGQSGLAIILHTSHAGVACMRSLTMLVWQQRSPTCVPMSKKMFCHQCCGQARLAVLLPRRQWGAGPGSPVLRNDSIRSDWHAAARAASRCCMRA